MRSGTNCTITSGEVFAEVRECLLQAKLVKDHGWLCTATVVLGIVLCAAGRSISVTAACRDMAHAPSDQAILTALEEGLPKTLPVLERRLNECLTGLLPSRMRRRAWPVAIDWHFSHTMGSRTRVATRSTTANRITLHPSDEGLGAFLQAGQGLGQLRRPRRVKPQRHLGAAGQIGQGGDELLQQQIVRHRAQDLAVHVFKLGEIKTRRRAVHLVERKSLDQVRGGEKFALALAPAESRQIVPQGFRKVTQRTIGVDAERGVSLRHLGAVRPVDQRDMGPGRRRPAHCLVDMVCRAALVR